MNTDIYRNLLIALAVLASSAVISPILAGRRKLAGVVNFLLTSIAGVILLVVAYGAIFGEGEHAAQLISFGPLGIHFLVDGFAGLFIGIVSFMAIISAFYSIEYMEHYPEYHLRWYYLCYPLFIFGMILLLTVDDLSVGFSIAWQIMTISSYFLIKFEYKKKENVRGANKYLVLMELAWLLVLVGTFFIGGYHFGDSMHEIVQKIGETGGVYLYAMYGFLLVGFGFKAGVFPLGQLWLPDAHSIAPSPISALLSGVMLKTGIYGIMRTFLFMVPANATFDGMTWGMIVATVGVLTLFIGTVQSMKQSDAKRLLAYSSIGQIGYIVFAVGAAMVMLNVQDPLIKTLALIAMIGSLFHVMNHAIFKGLLFLTSGSVLYATGTKDLNKLGGLIKIMPVSAVIAGIASLSIAGMPPFSGFSSKWTIISTSLLAGNKVMVLVIFGIIALFTSAVTLACYVKFFGMMFTSVGHEWNVKKEVKEVPAVMLIPKIILTLVCLTQGLMPFIFYRVVINVFQRSAGSIVQGQYATYDFSQMLNVSLLGIQVKDFYTASVSAAAAPIVVLIVVACAFLISYLFRISGGSKEVTAPTWLCGYQELNNLNRYTDKSMFAALKNLLWWTGGNGKNQ
ncbi:MAG: hypothetical protein JXA20_12805 [Spirochaetes bacterium]|nr:hypothetical protein [Spirochaetota bacterium]